MGRQTDKTMRTLSEALKEPIYYGIFLDKRTRQKLMDILNKDYSEQMSTLNRIYLDHCTCLHCSGYTEHPELRSKLDSKIGQKIKMNIVQIGYSDKAMAFEVENVGDLSANKLTHITIGTFKGGKPVDSNYITSWSPFMYKNVEGTIGTR